MKMFNKLTQNQLIGLVTGVFVVVLGVLLLTTTGGEINEEVSYDPNVAPPTLTIDTSYNATLSGEPFYIVTDDDQDMYDNSLDTCNELGNNSERIDLQNRWYQVVAYEDDMTVEEVIFSQIKLREGDKMIAVIYDAANQEFKAMPNKLILNTDGNNVEILEFDETLEKGTVVAVSANRDTDFCADYDEVGLHENIETQWNLVSRPDFDEVDYRAIWEVAFAKGGDSGVDPDRYYSYTDPDDSVAVADLPTDILYWVYGGEASTVTDGGDLPEEESSEQGFVVKVNNAVDNPNQAGERDVVNGETFEIDEEESLGFNVGLKETPDEDIEMRFKLEVDGVTVTNGRNDVVEITSLAVDLPEGRDFLADVSAETLAYELVSLDDADDESETVTLTVYDVAGDLESVSFDLKINDDESEPLTCTGPATPSVQAYVNDADGNAVTNATLIILNDSGQELERRTAPVGPVEYYSLLTNEAGSFTVRMELAGFDSQSQDVTVSRLDDCRVETSEVTFDLEEQDVVADTVNIGLQSYGAIVDAGVEKVFMTFLTFDSSELAAYTNDYWANKFHFRKSGDDTNLNDDLSFSRNSGTNVLRVEADVSGLADQAGRYLWEVLYGAENVDGDQITGEGSFPINSGNTTCVNRSIDVRVINELNQNVSGANVLLRQGDIIVDATNTTDDSGRANIVFDGGAGEFTVVASYDGYEDRVTNVNLENADCEVFVQISLEPSANLSLSLASNQVAADAPLIINLPDGYDAGSVCATNGSCSLSYSIDGEQVSSSDLFAFVDNSDREIRIRLIEDREIIDFYQGEHTIIIEGATYISRENIPRFEGSFTVN